jgi:predicted phage terminase large subunit-like protein
MTAATLSVRTVTWRRFREPHARILLSMFIASIKQRGGDPTTAANRDAPLLTWGRHYLPDHFTRPPSGMHRWLEQQFESAKYERRAKINAIGPRGGAKSTIGTLALPLRAALEGSERYIWIVSDSKHQAIAHLENIKTELLGNEAIARDYPQAAGRGRTWRAQSIVLRNGVAIDALGAGQRMRGKRKGAIRPTLIICDDLQNDQHIESAAARATSRQWFQGTLLKAGNRRSNIVHLATALHRDALAMELHRTAGWTSRVFAAIERWPRRADLWEAWEAIYSNCDRTDARQAALEFYESQRGLMDEGVALLWPEEEDLYTLMCLRAEGGRGAFEREKQGSPLNPERCEFPETYFEPHIWFEEWPKNLRIKTLALDPSKGNDGRLGDFSAYVMLGVDQGGMIYVSADLARRPTPELVADGVAHFRSFAPDAFGVETNQYQELLADQFDAEFSRQNVLAPRPYGIENHVSKKVRIRRLGPYLASRRLRFQANSPGTRLLVEQLKTFPVGDHDDGPDALEMAIRLAAELEGNGGRE